MNWLLGVSVALVVAAPVLLAWLFRGRRKPQKCVYQTNTALFTPEERTLFARLREALGDEFEIFAKIRVGEIIQPRKGTQVPTGRSSDEELTGHCFSFVLCRKGDLAVAGAVVLVDPAHGDQQPHPKDEGLLAALCAAAGLPLVMIHSSHFDPVEELREAVLNALKQPVLPVPHADGRKEPRISSIEGLNLD